MELQERIRCALKDDFERRLKRNPRFSLRSYAKLVGVDASLLSKVLSGKRDCSLKVLSRLTESGEVDFLPQLQGESTSEENNFAKGVLIEQDKVQLLSDWVHFAILELIVHPHCPRGETEQGTWIAYRLALPRKRIDMAIQRLIRTGFLEAARGTLRPTKNGGTTTLGNPALSSAAHKEFQRTLISASCDSLENVPIRWRDHSSLILSLSPRNMKRVKEFIRSWRSLFLKEFETCEESSEVYALNIGFFPLSKITDEKEMNTDAYS